MKTEANNKEMNIDERTICIEVDSDVIDGVRNGTITTLVMDINDHNQSLMLETFRATLF